MVTRALIIASLAGWISVPDILSLPADFHYFSKHYGQVLDVLWTIWHEHLRLQLRNWIYIKPLKQDSECMKQYKIVKTYLMLKMHCEPHILRITGLLKNKSQQQNNNKLQKDTHLLLKSGQNWSWLQISNFVSLIQQQQQKKEKENKATQVAHACIYNYCNELNNHLHRNSFPKILQNTGSCLKR